ncbi:MAG: hypothetical protein ACEY3D_00710 [Rickettsia sp.]
MNIIDRLYEQVNLLCHTVDKPVLLHGSLMSFPRRRESRKKV